MSQNWMRHFELVLSDDSGEGIVLSDLKVTFEIEWSDVKFPSVATVKVYNLSPHTQNRIMKREFSKMQIIAGYDGIAPDVTADQVGKARSVDAEQTGQRDGQNFGLIYSGDIRFTVTGKDNPTDSWVMIQACDSLEAYLNAFISTTLAKGYTVSDVYHLLMRSLEPYGIAKGSVPEFPHTVYPRGKVFHGFVHEYLDNVAEQCGATWQFAYGRLDMRTKDMIAHDAVLLNADTGLVGMPQQTIGAGVNVQCFINSRIKIGGLIQLDQASVYRNALSSNDVARSGVITEENRNGNRVLTGTAQQPASVATDGVYIVRWIQYRGDTRGQNWCMEMACEARGAADLYSASAQQKVYS